MNVVGIVAALAVEARALGPTIGRHKGPASLVDGTLLSVSGIGCAAAALAARALVKAGATALASWGVAGGLDPALSAGTIFLPSEVIASDGTVLQTACHWRGRLGAAIAAHRPLVHGRLLTTSHAIGGVAAKAAVFAETGAAAVDMESVAVAQIAGINGLPFIAVRVIVDTAQDVLPRMLMAASRSGHVQAWRLIGALALAPADLAPLIRLAQRYRAANRSLAAIARTGALGALAFPTVSDGVSSCGRS